MKTMRLKQRNCAKFSCRHSALGSINLLLAHLLLFGQQLIESAPRQHKPQTTQVAAAGSQSNSHYFGSPIGKLERRGHNVSGEVFAVDEQTLFIRGFSYDGLAPDAYFWSSVSAAQPSAGDGFIVPDEKGSTKPLERYADKDIVLRLPEGRTLREIQWLSVWSRQNRQSAGEILIPRQLQIPRPLELGPVSQLAHGLRSGPITIVDAQTFLVPDFHYDGLGPEAHFWLTRGQRGLSQAGSSGVDYLRLKDENGSAQPLRRYAGETVVISLPDDATIYDFDFFGVWCRKFEQDFGHARIPPLAKVPPSPKMLGIRPENKLNCEILYDDLGYEIRWVLDGDDIVMQLVGKIEPNEYMAFGLGKDDSRSEMQAADAVVAWVDRASGQVHAVDYFLGAKQQCGAGGSRAAGSGSGQAAGGSCPDSRLPGGGDSLTLLHGAIVNGYSMVTFKRPQLGVDELYDQHVYSDGQQSVLWAIGTLNANQEIGYHRLRTRQNMFIDFARNPQWNCPIPDLNASMQQAGSGSSSTSSSAGLPVAAASQVDPTTLMLNSNAESDKPEVATRPPVMRAPKQQPQVAPSSEAPRVPPVSESAPRPSSPMDEEEDEEEEQQADDDMKKPAAHSTAAGRNSNSRVQQQPGGALLSAEGGLNRTALAAAAAIAALNEPWFIPSISCPAERTFYAQIGPTGGHRGYEALTGRSSWGVSWYINGLMIPELVLERGQSYLFVVEGGSDKTSATRRHPFYLTDSPEGGFDFKTDEERVKERVFGGVALRGDGQLVPTAEGRLCEWKPTNQTHQNPDLYPTFAAYQRSLRLDCLPGQASVLKFTPDANTPDLIYYQCYTHRFMGWRVRIVNSCSSHLAQATNSQPPPNPRLSIASANSNNIIRKNNNNNKRDTRGSQSSILIHTPPIERPTYERRAGNINQHSEEQTKSASSRQSTFLDLSAETSLLDPTQPTPTQSMNDITTSALPNELLVFNSTHLSQRQPLNLSTFDEILKLSPADLEFLDSQAEVNALDQLQPTPIPLWLVTQNQNQTISHQNQVNSQGNNKTNKTTAIKLPKTLHSYMRRLAAIYHPVQQQLASLLATNQNASPQQELNLLTQQQQQLQQLLLLQQLQQQQQKQQQQLPEPQTLVSSHQQPSASTTSGGSPQMQSSASEQVASGFSLSNLVPKSKIDLSKSTITKKLNKFRFKSSDKQKEKVNQPPTSAIEFNYDIFNNQLAQMEKQQKQFQSIDYLGSDSTALNYLPMMPNPVNEQQAIDAAASMQLLSNLHGNQLALSYQQSIPNANNYLPIARYRPPLFSRYPAPGDQAEVANQQVKAGAQLSQQNQQAPAYGQYLPQSNQMQLFNKTNVETPAQSQQFHWMNLASVDQQPIRPQYLPPQPQPLALPVPQQPQQHSIFITKYPIQQQTYHPLYRPQQSATGSPRPAWPSVQVGASVRYPNIQPYGGHQQQTVSGDGIYFSSNPDAGVMMDQFGNGAMTTMPSVAQTTHDTLSAQGQTEAPSVGQSGVKFNDQLKLQRPESQLRAPGSTASEASASSDEYQSQSTRSGPQSSASGANQEPDHMLAIERFSKQPSERRPPSIVHPVTGEQVRFAAHHNQLQPAEESRSQQQQQTSDGQQPRRYSNLLIDKNLLASSSEPSAPITGSYAGNAPSFNRAATSSNVDLLSVEQTQTSGDLRRLRPQQAQQSTSTGSERLKSSEDSNQLKVSHLNQQQQSPSTESIGSQVLVKPAAGDQSATSTMGPLIPSLGPPTTAATTTPTGDHETVLKSTLVDPLISTLVAQPSEGPSYSQAAASSQRLSPFLSHHHFDLSPFTPIELTGPMYFAPTRVAQLRPSPLVESMLTAAQQSPTFRPEPPVQVASFLARHLAAGGANFHPFDQSPAAASSAQPVAVSWTINQQPARGGSQQEARGTGSSELIILKPALVSNQRTKQAPLTYLLKPEYMTKLQLRNSNNIAAGRANSSGGQSLSENELYSGAGSGGQTSIGGSNEPPTDGSVRPPLVGHQFDRLSSLSSPPTTSMALDPMQAAHTVNSYVKQSSKSTPSADQTTGGGSSAEKQLKVAGSSTGDGSAQSEDKAAAENKGEGGNGTSAQQQQQQSAQHRQSHLLAASKQMIGLNFEQMTTGENSQNSEGMRLNPGGESSLMRDNNTDNAILSHVMSLISANAIPAPPLMPSVVHSGADYFLPARVQRSIRWPLISRRKH